MTDAFLFLFVSLVMYAARARFSWILSKYIDLHAIYIELKDVTHLASFSGPQNKKGDCTTICGLCGCGRVSESDRTRFVQFACHIDVFATPIFTSCLMYGVVVAQPVQNVVDVLWDRK